MSKNEIKKLFKFEGARVRTIIIDGKMWFVAKDVCDILDIKNTSDAVKRLKGSQKTTIVLTESGSNYKTNGTAVSESGLYKLIFRSRKPEAELFQDWVYDEVLPTINKTGGYVQEDRAIDFVNSWLPQLDDDSSQAIASTLEQNRKLVIENKQLVTTIEESKPLVTFAERCLSTNESILVRELAKVACDEGINIGEKRLYKKLREWNLVMPGKTEPTQYGMDRKLFEVKQGIVSTPYGDKTTRTTKVMPKGQVYIVERLIKESSENIA